MATLFVGQSISIADCELRTCSNRGNISPQVHTVVSHHRLRFQAPQIWLDGLADVPVAFPQSA